ncbi:hypothetical protein Plhal304r1_c057g0143941 [Plasmopara halstedii]
MAESFGGLLATHHNTLAETWIRIEFIRLRSGYNLSENTTYKISIVRTTAKR